MQQHHMRELCVSEPAFCNWVGSRPVRIHTLNEPYQSSFGSRPRPPLQLGLGAVVWCAPECDCCIHTCPQDPHQEGKQTWVRFNWTKQDRCEYTLSFAQKSQNHDHVTTLWSSPARSSAVVCTLLILFVGCSTVNKLRSEDPWAYAWRTAAQPAVLTRKSAAVSVMTLVWLWRTWEGHRRVQALVCNPLYAAVGLCYGESSDPYTITVNIQSK